MLKGKVYQRFVWFYYTPLLAFESCVDYEETGGEIEIVIGERVNCIKTNF